MYNSLNMPGYSRTALEYHHEAVKLLKEGSLKEAEEIYVRLLELEPTFVSAYNNLGIILRTNGDLEGAKVCYQKAVELNPQYFQGYSNLGNVLKLEGKFGEAEIAYRKALGLNPKFADAHNNLGGALQLMGRLEEAAESYESAIKIKPDYIEAYGNLGGVLLMMGKVEQAETCLRVVENTDNMPEPIYNLANLIKEKEEELPEAVRLYKKVIKQEKDHSDALNGLLGCLRQLCDWNEAEKISTRLDILTKKELDKGNRTGETPYTAISRSDDPKRNLQIAQAWSSYIENKVLSQNLNFYFDKSRKTHSKIRIGYLSKDFTDHPIGHIIKGLFTKHDRRKFEVYCFSFGGNITDKYKKKIEQGCDHFVDISFMSFSDAAQRIHAEEIDILVDLMGHTNGTRLEIMAFRPAPVQISYLGFPGSLGADFIDYQIVDKVVVPQDVSKYYTEKLIYMPDCYQVNDSTQKISRKKFKRSDFNLPEGAFVFCSFNRLFKITPELFNCWMRILKEVPDSVLWLQGGNKISEANLRREALTRGINPERLIFSGMIPLERHLNRLMLSDLMLDTYIYSGGASTSHALRMGIPLVSLPGKTYLSRMSASLLHSVGMDELIAQDLKEYVDLAVKLANNPLKLKALKKRLAKNLKTTNLFNTKEFVHSLERVYQKVWSLYLSGEGPQELERKPRI